MQSRMVQDINKVAEGLVTTVEVSEGVVDSLCVQEWDEGLSMDRHQERSMGVEAPGWVRRVADDVVQFYFFLRSACPESALVCHYVKKLEKSTRRGSTQIFECFTNTMEFLLKQMTLFRDKNNNNNTCSLLRVININHKGTKMVVFK